MRCFFELAARQIGFRDHAACRRCRARAQPRLDIAERLGDLRCAGVEFRRGLVGAGDNGLLGFVKGADDAFGARRHGFGGRRRALLQPKVGGGEHAVEFGDALRQKRRGGIGAGGNALIGICQGAIGLA